MLYVGSWKFCFRGIFKFFDYGADHGEWGSEFASSLDNKFSSKSPIVTFREQFVMYLDFSFDEVWYICNDGKCEYRIGCVGSPCSPPWGDYWKFMSGGGPSRHVPESALGCEFIGAWRKICVKQPALFEGGYPTIVVAFKHESEGKWIRAYIWFGTTEKTQVVLLVVQSERIGHVLSICPYGIQISARPGRCYCRKGCGNSHKYEDYWRR